MAEDRPDQLARPYARVNKSGFVETPFARSRTAVSTMMCLPLRHEEGLYTVAHCEHPDHSKTVHR